MATTLLWVSCIPARPGLASILSTVGICHDAPTFVILFFIFMCASFLLISIFVLPTKLFEHTAFAVTVTDKETNKKFLIKKYPSIIITSFHLSLSLFFLFFIKFPIICSRNCLFQKPNICVVMAELEYHV